MANHEIPEGSDWAFRIVPLEKFNHIPFLSIEDKGEADDIKKFKREYLERRCNTPLIVMENMYYIIDGYHHLAAFREAIKEDNTLQKKIECWVRVDHL